MHGSNIRRTRPRSLFGELCADAPIAFIDFEDVSNSSKLGHGCSTESVHARSSSGSVYSLDFGAPIYGSLSDLVLNFEDTLRFMQSDELQNSTERTEVTLSQVKQWWSEASDPSDTLDYPLQSPPAKLGPYGEEFELVDADGLTEDPSDHGAVIVEGEQVALANSSGGHVTTDSSDSLSSPGPQTPLRSSAVDDATLEIDVECSTSIPYSFEEMARSDDLIQYSVNLLKRHITSLNTQILKLSDQLVQLLNDRDELVMLREATDDFVILLRLVHQRRTRASRAALRDTVRPLIRPRGLSRLRLPWPGDAHRATTTSPSPRTSPNLCNGDTVMVTFPKSNVDSLHLDSKLRRPTCQPIATSKSVQQANRSASSFAQDVCDSETPSVLSSDRAVKRLAELRKMCATSRWPKDQPHLSQCLSLHIPLIKSHGRTLAELRVINQILYATLLENPNVNRLVRAYTNDVNKFSNVSDWLMKNAVKQ